METPAINTQPVAATPNVVPPMQEAMVAMPNTTAPQPMATMADGGQTKSGNSITDFFKSLNVMEVGLSILSVTALFYIIHYYKFKMNEDKMINNELQKQIDEIKMNIQSTMKGKYKTI